MQMSTEVLVAVLSLVGTAVGSIAGILAANRLSNYRIQQLEKKVDEHNNYARRLPVVEEEIKELNRRMNIVEKELDR